MECVRLALVAFYFWRKDLLIRIGIALAVIYSANQGGNLFVNVWFTIFTALVVSALLSTEILRLYFALSKLMRGK